MQEACALLSMPRLCKTQLPTVLVAIITTQSWLNGSGPGPAFSELLWCISQ